MPIALERTCLTLIAQLRAAVCFSKDVHDPVGNACLQQDKRETLQQKTNVKT